MQNLQIAFVGCGGFAAHYLNVYRAFDWAQVAVCVDADEKTATDAAQIFGAKSSGDFAEALGENVNVVIINTPNHLHRSQAVAALEAGKHVLLQKPVAQNLADAEIIAEAADRAAAKGVLSGLYMNYFDQPLIHDLKKMRENGWFGDITHLAGRLMHRGGMDWSRQTLGGKENWRGKIAETGGGCFIQLAVHYVHLFEWLISEKVRRVTALAKNLHCAGLEGEDLLVAILEFESGVLATLETAWNTAGELLSVHGTSGSLEYLGNRFLVMQSLTGDFRGKAIDYRSASGSDSHISSGVLQTAEISPPAFGDSANEFNQHRLFLEAVRDGQKPFVSIASGVRDLHIVSAVYESVRTGRAVELEVSE